MTERSPLAFVRPISLTVCLFNLSDRQSFRSSVSPTIRNSVHTSARHSIHHVHHQSLRRALNSSIEYTAFLVFLLMRNKNKVVSDASSSNFFIFHFHLSLSSSLLPHRRSFLLVAPSSSLLLPPRLSFLLVSSLLTSRSFPHFVNLSIV